MKRIKKPSLEFLLGLKHGQKVNVSWCSYDGEAIVNNKETFAGKPAIYFCQDLHDGSTCEEKFGKKYSYVFIPRTVDTINWIELLDEEPESLEDENNFAVIPTEETIVFDDYDMLAIWLIESNMK